MMNTFNFRPCSSNIQSINVEKFRASLDFHSTARSKHTENSQRSSVGLNDNQLPIHNETLSHGLSDSEDALTVKQASNFMQGLSALNK